MSNSIDRSPSNIPYYAEGFSPNTTENRINTKDLALFRSSTTAETRMALINYLRGMREEMVDSAVSMRGNPQAEGYLAQVEAITEVINVVL